MANPIIGWPGLERTGLDLLVVAVWTWDLGEGEKNALDGRAFTAPFNKHAMHSRGVNVVMSFGHTTATQRTLSARGQGPVARGGITCLGK